MSLSILSRTPVVLRRAALDARTSVPRNAATRLLASRAARSPVAVSGLIALRARSYATAVSAAAPAKRAPPTRAKTARTAGRASTTKRAATAAAKTKKKTAGKKTAAKRKAAAKPKPKPKPKKKVLTERQKQLLAKKQARDLVTSLKEKALTAPSRLPDSPMALYIKETVSGSKSFTEAATAFKNISSAELQRFTATANTNRELNARAYQNWVESLSPVQIKEANAARRRLSTLLKNYAYHPIQDPRVVTRPRSSFVLFFKDHFAAQHQGDEKVSEVMARVATMWRNLSAEEKQVRTLQTGPAPKHPTHNLFSLTDAINASEVRLNGQGR
ncbi:hypothetical protein KEM52_001543 [Ascosphaera acerosa]|nr:hypothetical protein KEM52_001543 [Ascosphaera acerosa]